MYVNRLDLHSPDDLDYGLYTVATFYAGLQVGENISLAEDFISNVRGKRSRFYEADALMMCTVDENYALLKSLIDLGLDPLQCDAEGLSALSHAQQFGDEKALRLLSKQGGDSSM